NKSRLPLIFAKRNTPLLSNRSNAPPRTYLLRLTTRLVNLSLIVIPRPIHPDLHYVSWPIRVALIKRWRRGFQSPAASFMWRRDHVRQVGFRERSCKSGEFVWAEDREWRRIAAAE